MNLKNLTILSLCFFLSSCNHLFSGNELKFSGTVEVTEHSLSFPVPARISEINAEEGSDVKKGDILAVSDRYEQTKKDYQRLEALLKIGGADSQTAEHAKLAMEDQKIESPVDGEILVKAHQSGETLTAGSPVLILGEIASPWIRLYIPEGKIQNVKKGQKAVIRLDGTNKNIHGEVFYVSPKAEFTPRNIQTAEERVTQTFLVKVRLLDNNLAHPGVFGNVTLEK